MALLIQVFAISSLVLGGFLVFLPRRREHFAGVFTLSVLAFVLCSGFKSLSSDEASTNPPSPREVAANLSRAGD